MEGNGHNRFFIVVKSPRSVHDEEWADLLFVLNDFLQKYYVNVGAHLEEIPHDERS